MHVIHWSCACHIIFKSVHRVKNSTKYRADDLCTNFVCDYFCWILDDPTHFFFGRSLPFLILSIILKNKKNLYVGSFNYFSYTIQIGSNWYMDTGVRTQKLYFLRLILADNLSNRPIYAVLNTYNFDMILQLKHMRIVMNPARIALYDWKS